MSDHMESPTDPTRTRCGRDVNHVPDYVWGYGAIEAYCKTCRRLYAKDQINLLKSKAKPGLPRKYYKCARTDCGVAGCECSSLDPEPPEFCIYDNDEAHWDEIKGGDDK